MPCPEPRQALPRLSKAAVSVPQRDGLHRVIQSHPVIRSWRFYDHAGGADPDQPLRVSRSTGGEVNLSVTGETDLLYVVEASTNLVTWARLGVRTNLTGSIQFSDSKATNFAKRFY